MDERMDERTDGLYSTREEIEALLEDTRNYTGPEKKRKSKKQLTKGQRAVRIIANSLYCVLVLSLCIMLYLGINAKKEGELPGIFGYRVFMVKTGSMVPTLPIGCYILSHEPKDPANIPIGTITTFYFENGTVVTHRITEKYIDDSGNVSYVTEGDNPLNDPDPELLTPDRVVGTFVFKVTLPKLWGE